MQFQKLPQGGKDAISWLPLYTYSFFSPNLFHNVQVSLSVAIIKIEEYNFIWYNISNKFSIVQLT